MVARSSRSLGGYEMSNVILLVIVIEVFLLTSPVAAKTGNTWKETIVVNRSNFSVSDLAKQAKFGVRTITGTVTNNTFRSYTHVQIEISLYDQTGALVGSTVDDVNNLSPNSQWKFSAPVLGAEDAVHFKVEEITGF